MTARKAVQEATRSLLLVAVLIGAHQLITGLIGGSIIAWLILAAALITTYVIPVLRWFQEPARQELP